MVERSYTQASSRPSPGDDMLRPLDGSRDDCISALRAVGLLNSPYDERFDRLTRLLQRLLGAPATFISLLGEERQYFLSAHGLAEPWASLGFTPLSFSLCRLVVDTGQRFVVSDTRDDPRFSANPALSAFDLVAYIAEPLSLPGGRVVGALCAIDHQPRVWTEMDEEALEDLARIVMAEIAAGLRLRELELMTAELQTSEERHRALLDVSLQMVWLVDGRGEVTFVNQQHAKFIGRNTKGENWLEVVHPEDRTGAHDVWRSAMARETECEIEFRARRASDGATRWILSKGTVLRSATGEVECWMGVGIDIDERKRAENALRRLIEGLAVAVYTTDAAGRLTLFNQAAVELWGQRPPLGRDLSSLASRLCHPDGSVMKHNEYPTARALREERSILGAEILVERLDGRRVPCVAYPTPLRDESGAIIGAVNAVVDVTDREAAQAALRASEVRLRLALEAGRLAFWELDPATGAVIRAPFHDQIFGYAVPLPEWSYDTLLRHVLPEDRAGLEQAYRATMEGRRHSRVECRIRRVDDGEVRWIELHGQAQRGPDGKVACLLGVLQDITDRKRTEAALRDGEARLRSILQTVPEAIVVIDERGIVESFSRTAERLFGYTNEEIVGQEIWMLIPSPDRERFRAHFARTLGTGDWRNDGFGPAITGQRKDRSIFPMEITVGEIRADGRRIFTGFMNDLSARRATEARLQELQAELLHVSRLSAAGEMASTLAHELNQPLTAAATAIRAAQRMLAAAGSATLTAEIGETMDLAAEQAVWAGQIVRRLREFVSRGGAEPCPEDLHKLIEGAGALALVDVRERGIEVTLRIEAGLHPVVVDRIQIQQVLFNLIRNAVEAMSAPADPPDAAAASSRGHELVLTACPAGPDWIEVAVMDTGPGIAPDISGRLFDSFVSSKPGGLGMGLSICRSIVEAHGGRLWAEPRPGGGAIFRFTLPATSSERDDDPAG